MPRLFIVLVCFSGTFLLGQSLKSLGDQETNSETSESCLSERAVTHQPGSDAEVTLTDVSGAMVPAGKMFFFFYPLNTACFIYDVYCIPMFYSLYVW